MKTIFYRKAESVVQKKLIFHLVSCFFLLILPLLSYADQTDVEFKRISTREGLSQTSVSSIVQDFRGFMWFGTEDGLNRYDGRSFRIYNNDFNDAASLSYNNISAVFEDKQKNLWIGTLGGGLNKYIRDKDKFIHYTECVDDSNCITDNFIRAIIEDHLGRLWIGTDNGLNIFDPKTEIFTKIFSGGSTKLDSSKITALLEDDSGLIWIGTNNGLHRYDPGTKEIDTYYADPKDLSSLSDNFILYLMQDKTGNIWAGTNNGLNKLDLVKNTISQYKTTSKKSFRLSHNKISNILQDKNGNIWVSTDGGGLNKLNPKTDKISFYKSKLYNPQSLASNHVAVLYEDRSGIIWIGTRNGLNKYDQFAKPFRHYKSEIAGQNSLNANDIYAFYEDDNDILWIGTYGGGLNRLDRKTETFKYYTHNADDPASISNDKIRTIIKDKYGILWVGTENGLNQFNNETESFRRINHNPNDESSLSSSYVRIIFEDKTGSLWIGTTNGLNLFDHRQNRFIRYFHDPQDSTSLSNNYIYSIIEDSDGDMWIGTISGLNRFDRNKQKFITYNVQRGNKTSLNNNEILSIYQDDSGIFWMATAGGINKFNKETGEFKFYTEKDGLPGDLVFNILEDNQGSLWLSTVQGLSKFNPQTEEFRNFDVSDGIQDNEFDLGAALKLRSGEFLFGGINGFNLFHPDSINDNQFIPPIVLTDFQIFNKSIPISSKDNPNNILTKSINEADRIKLSYKDRVLLFQFVALHFSAPEKNKYAYILEGFDEKWNQVGNRNFASYTNVPPGEYVFRVIGSNSDNVWNEEGASLHIEITPPFWETSWFRAIVFILLISFIFSVYKIRTKSIRDRNLQLASQVKERTQELENTNQNLKYEMKEREKVKQALMQSEERFRSIFENSTIGQYRTTPDGKIQMANPALLQMLGYNSIDEISDVNLEEGLTQVKKRDEFRKKLERDGKLKGWEDTWITKDGKKLYIRESSNLIKNEDGSPIYYEGTVEDITEQKIAQQKLIEAKEDAEAATKAKSDFLANMSHEIRTPMNGVIGMTSLLLDTDLSKEQTEFADTIQSSANTLLNVINDILDFSKIEAGKLDIEEIDFELRNTVENVANIMAFKAYEKNLGLTCAINHKIPDFLIGDPGRLRQILTNLINNALKFTSRGEISIKLEADKETDSEINIRFNVKDTGIGIPQDKMNVLFKSFSQVDASTTRKYGGTGLGLAISRNLVHIMKGEIGVESKEGEGSTFWFSIPFTKQKHAVDLVRAENSEISKKHILIVDDDKTNRLVLKEQLKYLGCRFEEAVSGKEALAKLKQYKAKGTPFNLAVLDMQMPEMSGETLGKKIKEDTELKDTILIMLTSVGARGDAAKMKNIGFSAYLTKPIQQSQLYDCLAAVIGKKSAETAKAKNTIITRHTLAEIGRKKNRLLLAEDNLINQKVAVRILEKMGYSVVPVLNGREAIESLAVNEYDLILMDVQMPEMDGFEATKKIRQDEAKAGSHIPIIAMTAHAMKGDRERCLAAGMDDYVSKPIQRDDLEKALKRQLGTAAV